MPTRLARAARMMMAVGGVITFIVIPLLATLFLLLIAVLAIGFGEDSREADRVVLLSVGILLVVVGTLLFAWWRALRGGTIALVVMLVVGVLLAVPTAALIVVRGAPGDRGAVALVLLFGVAFLGPALLATGALVGLLALRATESLSGNGDER